MTGNIIPSEQARRITSSFARLDGGSAKNESAAGETDSDESTVSMDADEDVKITKECKSDKKDGGRKRSLSPTPPSAGPSTPPKKPSRTFQVPSS